MEPIVFMPGRSAPVSGIVFAVFGIAVGIWIAVLDFQRISIPLAAVFVLGSVVVLVRSLWTLMSDTPQLVVTGEGFHSRGSMPVAWSEVEDMDQGEVKIRRGLNVRVIRVWLLDPQAYVDRAVPSVARRAVANLADGNPAVMISPPDRFGNGPQRAIYAEVIAALRAGHDYAAALSQGAGSAGASHLSPPSPQDQPISPVRESAR